MSSINKRFFILFLVLAFSISTVFAGTFENNFINRAAFGKFGSAALATEKTNYLSGENVVLSGSGFGRNESVSLSVETYSEALAQSVPQMQWNVYANARGAFSATIAFDSLRSQDGKYTILAVGSKTGAVAETVIIDSALQAIGVDIEQCANGPQDNPVNCDTAGANRGYGRGNLVPSKSHYREGDFVPIRIVLSGLDVGQSYTVTVAYDFTKGGKYAIDYLGNYNYTESVNNNPCVGVAGCDINAPNTAPVPLDDQVKAGFDGVLGTSDDITQIPGNFTIFGGTITNVSDYTFTGTTADTSTKSLTLTFTASSTNVVIAYGSHISTRKDWGAENSAINISGSPYHNFILQAPVGANSGNRDLQFGADAVIFLAEIRIIKDAQPNSCLDFGFSTTGQRVTSFSLDDDAGQACADNTLSNTFSISNLELFGPTNRVTVTEGSGGSFSLTQINCQSFANGATGTVNNNTFNLLTRSATIELEEGELVVCTFVNAITTAANVRLGGRVTDAVGTPVSRASVTVQNLSNGETQTVATNSFGFYSFEGLPSGESYVVTVSHRRYTFSNNSQIFTLSDAVENLDFIADSQ